MGNEAEKPLRILHLEDSRRDAELIRERLTDAGVVFQLDWAANEEQFTVFLQSGGYDLVLADYHLPGLEGEAALQLTRLHCPGIPFICVSGAIGEEKAVELLKLGATDYVPKGRLGRLSLAIERALAEARERSERRLAMETLRLEKERAQRYLDTVETIILSLDSEGLIESINRKGLEILGYDEDDLLGKNWFTTCLPQPEGVETIYPYFLELISGKMAPVEYFENYVITRNSQLRRIAWHNSLLTDEEGRCIGILSGGEDITERKILENQLLQAQKMESVGRLAGGVAHDFNNMLGVILGNVDLATRKITPDHPLQKELLGISIAAERAAGITRQLLAFARKQTIAPKVLDLNETVESMLKILRRLIGENIELSWMPGAVLWPVMLDPSQEDQILANLCVNARDAIVDIGRLTIETENVVFNEQDCVKHSDLVPGEYVMLAVSDNGCGMDKCTLDKIFEPFFTTKGVGEGTGLGLATVYGIVKQNNGFINVYSEPGQGTTFRIYLPRYEGDVPSAGEAVTTEIPRGHGETVLLVEDEPSLLQMTSEILEMLEYKVLSANSPDEAIRLSGEQAGEIHLLMTDVVMPGMNGRDLAEKLRPVRPAMKCLFTSGYTADVIAHHGVLEEGVQFIQKPCAIQDLASKIREVLEG